jgi:hypothetical protein
MLCPVFYIGKGRKPPFIDVLNCIVAFDGTAYGALHLAVNGVILRERRKIVAIPGFISPGKKTHNLLAGHDPKSLLYAKTLEQGKESAPGSSHRGPLSRLADAAWPCAQSISAATQ